MECKVFHKITFKKLIVATIVLRLCLGSLFVYTSLHKIYYATKFKEAIANFEILPYWMINITAIVLPWLEFWIGIFLISGILVRSCTIIQIFLLLVFISAIGLNIARGLQFYCGCFPEENMITGTNFPHIVFNTFLVLLALILYTLERRRFNNRYKKIAQ